MPSTPRHSAMRAAALGGAQGGAARGKRLRQRAGRGGAAPARESAEAVPDPRSQFSISHSLRSVLRLPFPFPNGEPTEGGFLPEGTPHRKITESFSLESEDHRLQPGTDHHHVNPTVAPSTTSKLAKVLVF